jgi:hypothetical protein
MLDKILKIKNVKKINKQHQSQINGGGYGGSCFQFCQKNDDCRDTCGPYSTCDKWVGICVS